MSEFDKMWSELLHVLRRKMLRNEPVKTLCRNVKNFILEIGEDYIIVRSERSKRGLPRKILRKDFELVYYKLLEGPISTLKDIREVIGRRAIICSILALHQNVIGRCEHGKVILALRD
ncbi:MAG TPA: hypothetical protein ENF87_02515 [Thermoproteales archaeon]|nr:hypothetical protein [Thermoproteales archaeon]